MFPATSGPPPLPDRKAIRIEQRQAACTHMVMTRLYDNFGFLRCYMCHRHPSIGWLYLCVQDHGWFSPATDFVSTGEYLPKRRTKEDDRVNRLSPATLHAIREGQYTDEQIKLLIEQKKGVRDTILAHVKRSNSPSSASEDSSSSSATTDEDTTLTTVSSMTFDEELRLYTDQKLAVCEPLSISVIEIMASGGVLPLQDSTTEPRSYQPASPCSWKICPSCRPTYRDRAIQHLDAVLETPYEEPPEWVRDNCRISDMRIVMQIGLPKLQRTELMPHVSPWEECSNNGFSSGSSNPESDAERPHDDQGTVLERNGFAARVRKALDQVKQSKSISNLRIVSTKHSNSSQESLRRANRSMLFVRRRSRTFGNEYAGRVIDDTPLQSSLILMIATNTPLPDTAEDCEDGEGSEVEVEDGVAVTEGVGFSVADINMQV